MDNCHLSNITKLKEKKGKRTAQRDWMFSGFQIPTVNTLNQ